MSETQIDDLGDHLRQALRSLRDETPANQLARASILAGVRSDPTLYAIALEETAYPQAELDLHLQDDAAGEHETRADWFGLFVARLSSAVNEVTKSMTHRKRRTPRLKVLAPTAGSVRVVLRAPLPEESAQGQGGVAGADDTTAESRALTLITGLLKMSEEHELREESPFTATTQTLSPIARQRVRSVARSVMDSGWSIEGSLSQRGRTLERLSLDPAAAQRLYEELNRTEVQKTAQTLRGTIDGQRHSLSTMWFIPDGSKRATEVAVTDLDLLESVTRLSAEPGLRVECKFVVFLSVPAGASEASQRSWELTDIYPVGSDEPLALDS